MKRFVGLFALISACTPYGPAANSPLSSDERTLWPVCWEADGNSLLPSDDPPHEPKCDNWEWIKWPNLPIKVGVVHNAAQHVDNIIAAVNLWNTTLGFDIVRVIRASDIGDDDVPPVPEILIGAGPDNPWLLGLAQPTKLDGQLRCDITLFGTVPLATVMHEIGHCLGLSHDATGPHVMSTNGKDWLSITVSPADLRALRILYGKGG